MLRERFAHRYHSHNLFGMYPRNRRGEPSRRGEGSSMDRAGGSNTSRRTAAAKVVDADVAPLVGIEALQAMIRLLRVVQVSIPLDNFLAYIFSQILPLGERAFVSNLSEG